VSATKCLRHVYILSLLPLQVRYYIIIFIIIIIIDAVYYGNCRRPWWSTIAAVASITHIQHIGILITSIWVPNLSIASKLFLPREIDYYYYCLNNYTHAVPRWMHLFILLYIGSVVVMRNNNNSIANLYIAYVLDKWRD